MSLDIELLESLFEGAKEIVEEYKKNFNRKQYELYYKQDMFQWEVIIFFIITKMESFYEMIVKGSVNWKDHYFWVQMIGKILTYNPQLTKNRLEQVVKALNCQEESIIKIWEDFRMKGFHDSAVIILDQMENKKALQIDRFILGYCFQGWIFDKQRIGKNSIYIWFILIIQIKYCKKRE